MPANPVLDISPDHRSHGRRRRAWPVRGASISIKPCSLCHLRHPEPHWCFRNPHMVFVSYCDTMRSPGVMYVRGRRKKRLDRQLGRRKHQSIRA
uniref:Uncharacterized protein n=1 Tax=Oryza sativa subsp. japonica TaxID=39947 RepID=Q6Z5E9_ORYSJ|nr:hypothetical protein [Oryza sativa Japonica Group]